MTRIIETDRFASLPAKIAADFIVIAPPGAAARRLSAPNQSLRSVAEKILRRSNIGIASPITARHLLKKAIRRVMPDRDAAAEASRIGDILGTVLRDGIDTKALKTHGSERARGLATIADFYRQLLSKQSLIDGDQALVKAAELVAKPEKIFVYGYFRARVSDVKFINTIAGDGSIYFVPCGDETIFASAAESVDWLVEQGWELRAGGSADGRFGGKLAARFASGAKESDKAVNPDAFVYPNIETEVRGTLAEAKRLVIEGTNPSHIAIVCRKANDYVRTIASVSQEYGLPVRTHSKITIGESVLGNFISLILDAVRTDFEFETTARLLHHRFGPEISYESWTAARLKRATGNDGWKDADVDLSWLSVGDARSLDGWIAWLRAALAHAEFRKNAGTNPAEILAFNRLNDSLNEILNLEENRTIEFDSFAAIIHELLQTVDIRFDPGQGGIMLYQPDTIIGGDFDHVLVVGMAEGMLPETTTEDPVIDFYEQRKLAERGIKFDSPIEFPRWEALSFYHVLLTAKKGVTLSYPSTLNIDEKIESPYFDRLGIEPGKARREFTSSQVEMRRVYLRRDDTETGDTVLQAARRQYAIERRRESTEPFDEFDGVTGIGIDATRRGWSVSQLTKIGQCPFKWFAERVLRLSTIEEADTELKSNVTGRLYHKTLQIAVEKAMNILWFRDEVLAGLEAAFLEAEDDPEISVKQLPNWEHRRSEHLETLRKAVASPAFIAENSRVIAAEKKFETMWEGLRISGRIDRIDDSPDGLVAVDYKLGSYIGKVKDETGELRIDLQLPIYSHVALPALFHGKPIAPGVYYSIGKQETIREKDVELERFAIRTKQMLAAGSFPVEPDRKRESCKYCEFDQVCRRGQRQSRKPKTAWS